MRIEQSTDSRHPERRPALAARSLRPALAVAAALLMALATGLPADAQASRTRPPENQGSSGGSSTSAPAPRPSSPPSTSGSSSSSSTSRRGGDRGNRRAGATRPDGGSNPQVIENDSRSYRYGSRRGYRYYDGYRGGYHPYGYYSSFGWNPYRYSWHLGYWGWYHWNPAYPYNYYPHTYYDYPSQYYGGPYRVPYYTHQVRDSMGALDLDLKPGDTEIFLDGQRIGTADDFDGWPQYLWLDQGDYHFVFYSQGRRTIAREYKVLPGVVIDVTDRLETGESTPPEELFPVPTERRDERLRRNADLRARAEARERADWRRRSEEIREERGDEWDEGSGSGSGSGSGIEPAPTGDFGSLLLEVEPPDASVYLDGEFLGTAADLARLRRGLTVAAGEHGLEVVRPGYEAEEIVFEVEPGEAVELAVRLDRN